MSVFKKNEQMPIIERAKLKKKKIKKKKKTVQ